MAQMTQQQVLLQRVGQFRTRVRLLLAQQWICVGLTAGAVVGLGFVVATRLRWWTDAVDYLWVLFVVGAIVGALYGLTRRITPIAAAQLADERANLKERLSTAIELADRGAESDVAKAQITDAARHAETLKPAVVLPWRAPRQLRYLAAAGVVLAASIFLPDLPAFRSVQETLDREAIKLEGQRITNVAKEMEKKLASKSDDENAEIMRRVNAEMKRLGKDMEKNRIPKKEAMLKLNELQKQLKEAENRISEGGKADKSLEKVSSQLMEQAKEQEKKGNSDAADAMKRMAQNVDKRDMDAAAKQLQELAEKLKSGKMTAEDARKAAETLEQMSKAMEGSNLENASQEMKDAAQKLKEAAQKAAELEKKMANAKSDAERQELQKQAQEQLQQMSSEAAGQCEKAGGQCQSAGKQQQAGSEMKQASEALQSAQQSLQQAGQQQAQSEGKEGEATESEMGQEFQSGESGKQTGGQSSGQQSGSQQSNSQNQSQNASTKTSSGGGPGRAAGGNVGPQDPIANQKKDRLVAGQVDPKGKKLSRTYKGTPDPTNDRAAYYEVVPERTRAAEASLNREEIPAPAKKTVRRYFESIQPGR